MIYLYRKTRTGGLEMDVVNHNKKSWDHYVESGNPWTLPVSPEKVERARGGKWQILLTPTKPVPEDWFPPLKGLDVLCLASGGGQQGPILAAGGARVTVFDNSPRQLDRDREVAAREGLSLTLVEGDMRDLSAFQDGSFDLVINPVSNCFAPTLAEVWQEAARVLRPRGEILAGFVNPVNYLFDGEKEKEGIFQIVHKLPYSDLSSISDDERTRLYGEESALEFGHSLEDQIGGQIRAGLVITGFYEDITPGEKISDYMPTFIATRARKLAF
jgi:SAM-dependent methyltransferase